MTERWFYDIQDNKQNVSTFLDLNATFDCVEHSVLVDKITVNSFSANSMGLISNYLIERIQVVDLLGQEAAAIGPSTVACILGPVLYNLYTQDFSAYLTPIAIPNRKHRDGPIMGPGS